MAIRNIKQLYLPALLVIALISAGCSAPMTQSSSAQQPSATTVGETVSQTAKVSGVPVLMYHSVGDEQGNDAVISRDLFAAQMEFLAREKFHPVSLDALYEYLKEGKPLPSKPVVLTFDDGYRDTYEIVYPILKKHGFVSTLFIPAAFIGERLTLAELKAMQASGMAIMPHSFSHEELGSMPPDKQAEEITKAKQTLDKQIQQDARHFCFPNGSYNPDTLRLLARQGFKLAVTIEPGWVKPGDDLLRLRRVWIGNQVSLRYFEERVTRSDYTIL